MSGHVVANLEMGLAVAAMGVAALLSVVAFVSYRRLGNPRLAFIGLAFVTMTFNGAWLVRESWRLRGTEPWLAVVAAFQMVTLVWLYLAVRRR